MVARDCSSEALVGETPVFSISAADRAASLGSLVVLEVEGSSRVVTGIGAGRGGAGMDELMPLVWSAAVGLEAAGAKMACGVSLGDSSRRIASG